VYSTDRCSCINHSVGSLSILLQRTEVVASERDLSLNNETDLQTIRNGCQNILSELERTLGKYTVLVSKQTYIGHKFKRVWKRLSLEPEDIRNLRNRVNDNSNLLNAFTLQQTRDDTIMTVKRKFSQNYLTFRMHVEQTFS
jgi:hypothetical protein